VTGVITTAVCATIALLAAIFILVTVVWPESATGSLKTQCTIFNFFNMTLLINQIVYTTFLANHRAKITAFLDGVKLSPQTVQAFITAIGQSDKYSKQHPGKSCSSTVFGAVRTKMPTFFQLSFLPFSLGSQCSSLPSS
jgi:hypothetical protein